MSPPAPPATVDGGRRYTRIEGVLYDITELIARHPGGQIIEAAVGIDATCLFATHHSMCVSGGDAKARQWLSSCRVDPSRQAEAAEAVVTKDVFARSPLYDEVSSLVRSRVDREAGARLFAAESVLWAAVLLWTMWAYLVRGALWGAALAPVAGSLFAMVSMHEATHQCTPSWWLNSVVNVFSLAAGLGGTQRWRFSHVRHHALTSDEDGDPDLYPFEEYLRYVESVPLRWYHRFQLWYAWPIYSLAGFTFTAEAVWFNPHPTYKGFVPIPRVTDPFRVWFERLLGASAFLLHIGLPLLWLPWYAVALFETMLLLSSLFLSCVFQVNHFTARALSRLPAARKKHGADWAAMQVVASNDFATDSGLWNHITGGLNFQVEHHLFPTLHHWHYPLVCEALREVCNRRGVDHWSYATFWDALKDHAQLLVVMGSGDGRKTS